LAEDQDIPRSRPRDREFPLSSDIIVDVQVPETPHRLALAADDFVVCIRAYTICADWLNNSCNSDFDERKSRINYVAYQLEKLDWFLGRRGGQDSLYAALHLLSRVNSVHRERITDGRDQV
jgi:hypothetical protein